MRPVRDRLRGFIVMISQLVLALALLLLIFLGMMRERERVIFIALSE